MISFSLLCFVNISTAVVFGGLRAKRPRRYLCYQQHRWKRSPLIGVNRAEEVQSGDVIPPSTTEQHSYLYRSRRSTMMGRHISWSYERAKRPVSSYCTYLGITKKTLFSECQDLNFGVSVDLALIVVRGRK